MEKGDSTALLIDDGQDAVAQNRWSEVIPGLVGDVLKLNFQRDRLTGAKDLFGGREPAADTVSGFSPLRGLQPGRLRGEGLRLGGQRQLKVVLDGRPCFQAI